MSRPERRRQLTTIMAADVVGFSKLVAEAEEATIRQLHAHREVIDSFIERHEGRIFNTGGDSVLAEFGSAVEAVRCAIAIQDELRVRNAVLVPERRLQYRIGINVGDVIIDGEDFLGDGVNVAARLEGVAEPGGICLSASTFEQVKSKLTVNFKHLGPQHVKNIPDPIDTFSITLAPLSVEPKPSVTETAPGTTDAQARKAGWWPAVVAAALMGTMVVVAVGLGYWYFSGTGPMAENAVPVSEPSSTGPANPAAGAPKPPVATKLIKAPPDRAPTAPDSEPKQSRFR